ncbi:MAG: protein translocase subunit yajC [Acidobacteriales bacterium]|nr:protein translocase subunit yajC [Terriglobales bacterium]
MKELFALGVAGLERVPVAVLLVQASGGGFGGIVGLLPLVFIFAIFYFLLIRPQQTKQKKWVAMLETLKSGDKIVTSGGIKGTIIAVKDDSFHLRVPPDNLRIEVVKSAVVTVVTEEASS